MNIHTLPWDDSRSWTKTATTGSRRRRVDLHYLPDGGAVLSHTDGPVGWDGDPTWGEGEWEYSDTARAEQHAADLLVEDRIITDFERYIRARRKHRTRMRPSTYAPWHVPPTGIEY